MIPKFSLDWILERHEEIHRSSLLIDMFLWCVKSFYSDARALGTNESGVLVAEFLEAYGVTQVGHWMCLKACYYQHSGGREKERERERERERVREVEKGREKVKYTYIMYMYL